MVEVKNKTVKKASNTSKVRKVSSKKNINLELSSDELYDSIKNKKKNNGGSNTKKRKVQKKEVVNNNELASTKNVEVLNTDENIEYNSDRIEEIDSSKKNDDLIITREIIFSEDKLDLKDDKILKELRDAIKEFDALDDTSEIVKYDEAELVDDDLIIDSFITKKKGNKILILNSICGLIKNKWRFLVFMGFFLLLFLFIYLIFWLDYLFIE